MDTMTLHGWYEAAAGTAPLFILAVGAVMLSLARGFCGFGINCQRIVVLALALLFAAASWLAWPSVEQDFFGGLAVDRLSYITSSVLSLALVCLAIWQFATGATRLHSLVPAVFVFFACALAIFSNSLVTLVIAMPMCATSLAIHSQSECDEEGARGAFAYLVIASAFTAMGSAFIFGSLGTFSLAEMPERISLLADKHGRLYFSFGTAMFLAGLFAMMAVAPFHGWIEKVSSACRESSSSLLAYCVSFSASIAAVRFFKAVGIASSENLSIVVFSFAALSVAWGALSSLSEGGLKSFAKSNAIFQSGFVVLALGQSLAGSHEMTPAIFVAASGMLSALALLSAVALLGGDDDFSSLAGLAKRRPVASTALICAIVSCAGVFPSVGFWGRYLVFANGLWDANSVLALGVGACWLLFAASAIRIVWIIVFRQAPQSRISSIAVHEEPPLLATAFFCSLIVVFFGILPETLIAIISAVGLG